MGVNTTLLSVREARRIIIDYFYPLEKVKVDIQSAIGFYLSEEITSPIDLPSFVNSSMDGFAVITEDINNASNENPVDLRVVGDIPAGQFPDINLKNGESVRVMTGAPVPKGANAVVPLEFTDLFNRSSGTDLPHMVRVYNRVKPGEYLRQVGEDIKKDRLVLEEGKYIRPQEIGFLAMLGISTVNIYRKPRIALFSTGDELIPLTGKLTPGKVFDSNSYTIGSLLEKYGAEVLYLGLANDTEQSVTMLLEKAVESKVDLIISSAGVSVGAFDYVRKVIEDHGTLSFWRINMRPGKPLIYGKYKEIPFIGLPGNPVSAYVCCEIFVKPAIIKMLGGKSLKDVVIKARLLEPIQSDGRESYYRAKVWERDGAFVAQLVEHQGSGNLYSLVMANAFLIVPSEVKSLPIDAEVDALLMDSGLDNYSLI